DEAVVKMAMVVVGEVVVVEIVHVVAVPIITVPRGATMPATSIPFTHTGDMRTTYGTAAKVAHATHAADVAHATHAADVAHCAHSAHTAHPSHTSAVAASTGGFHHCRSEKKAACDGGNRNYVCFHECTSSRVRLKRPPVRRLCLSKHSGRAKNLCDEV